jgi:hypothetical protein
VRLGSATLFCRFGSDQASVALDIMKRFAHGTTIQVELFRGTVDVPAVRLHVGNELSRR